MDFGNPISFSIVSVLFSYRFIWLMLYNNDNVLLCNCKKIVYKFYIDVETYAVYDII